MSDLTVAQIERLIEYKQEQINQVVDDGHIFSKMLIGNLTREKLAFEQLLKARLGKRRESEVSECIYKDKATGVCKRDTDLTEPYIAYCVDAPCPNEVTADNPELGGES